MIAVTFSSFGAPDVLEVVEVDTPRPGPGQVRVRVKAAGVQPFDARFRGGLFGEYVPAHFPQTVGNEFAGVVDEVGEGVNSFPEGSEVLGFVWQAGYAEHVVVGADQIVAKPAAMPWDEAGALSASGQTADTALEELAVGGDETVLIHAAAGGVGSFAVQLARERDASVVGTASERNHDYLRSLGAIPVAYGEGLVDRVRAKAPQGVDAALDAHGGDEAIQASVELVADRDRIGTLPRAGDQLHLHVGRVPLVAAELAMVLDVIVGSEQHQGRGLHHQAAVRTPRDRRREPRHGVAVEQVPGHRPGGLAELFDVGVEVGLAPGDLARADPAKDRAEGVGAVTDDGGGEDPLVPEAPEAEQPSGAGLNEGVVDVERHESGDSLRVAQAEDEAGPPAPVVADQIHGLLDPEGVEQRDQVQREDLGVVPAGRSVGPAEPAQIGADHPVAMGERADQLPPHPPMLGQPCSITSGGPSPATATCVRSPPALTNRCSTPSTSGIGRSMGARVYGRGGGEERAAGP